MTLTQGHAAVKASRKHQEGVDVDRIDAMKLFARVADAGSFSRAANDLGIGQPTVSRRIQDLEAQLGAELFQRTTRSLSLTEAGERFLARARAIISEFDEAEAEARGLDGEPVGLLRITAAHSLARRILAPQIATFLDTFPHVRIDLIEDDRYVDLVEEGIDVAFRFGTLPDSSLMAKKLGESRRRAWVSPGYFTVHGHIPHPSELQNRQAVLFRHASHGASWTFTKGGVTATVKVDGRLKVSSGDTLVRAAMDGVGVIIAPDWLICEEANAGRLVEALPGWEAETLELHAVWTGGRKLRGKAKFFIDHLNTGMALAPPSPCAQMAT